MKKLKCIKSVEFMGIEVYTEGEIYEYQVDVVNEELKGYMITGNGGKGYISVNDSEFENFEEYKEVYQIKAIYKGDLTEPTVTVITYDGDKFISTVGGVVNYYSIMDVIDNKGWLLFEVNGEVITKLKHKNLESALVKYNALTNI